MSDNQQDGLAELLAPHALAIRVQFAQDLANAEAAMNATDEQIAAVHALAASLEDDA